MSQMAVKTLYPRPFPPRVEGRTGGESLNPWPVRGRGVGGEGNSGEKDGRRYGASGVVTGTVAAEIGVEVAGEMVGKGGIVPNGTGVQVGETSV